MPSPQYRPVPPWPHLNILIGTCAMALTLMLSYLTINANSLSTPSFPAYSEEPCPALPSKVNITIYKPDTPLAPSPLPAAHHASDADQIIPRVLSLTRSSTFNLISALPLKADTFEPEGLLILPPNRLVISSAEYTVPTEPCDPSPCNGTDRTPGAGYGHLQTFSLDDGSLIADASISTPRSFEYHNGGIDYDGENIYGVLGQRRPNSSATIYAASPDTLQPKALIHVPDDHLGTLVVNPLRHHLTVMNWGSRVASVYPVPHAHKQCSSQRPISKVANPSYFVDYQDCKFLGPHEGRDVVICSGVLSYKDRNGGYVLGGIALVDAETMEPIFELPIMLESEKGVRMTMNPFDVGMVDGNLRLYWAPDQHNTTLYTYEVRP